MSEDESQIPTCPLCHKPISDCHCQTITVKHEGLPESQDQIKKERDTLKSQLSILALKEFEREKIRLAEKLSRGDVSKQNEIIDTIGDDVDILRTFQAKATIEELDDGTEKVPPVGRAKAQAPTTRKQTLVSLYETLNSKTASVEEKAVADAKLDKLFKNLLTNRRREFKRALREMTED